EVEKICTKTTVEGTSSEMSVRGEFHPLNPSPQSAELFDIYCGVAELEGVSIEGEHSGGCADSGFIAAAGTPVICGVGPVGGNYHRPDEWMQVDSLSERARFIAKTIQKLAEKTTNSSL
ncbi:MAG: M20/M25/M40 family metallo-hydrolase, partial [Pseudomonadota bacterium]|nr:M20/M25/M40 family metallo-hydrolase [Pseudomonadota bacterium]